MTDESTPSRARPKTTGHAAWPDVLGLVRRGHFLEPACRLHGINPESVKALMRDDESVAEMVAEARAAGEIALRERLDRSDDWKREAWLLERFQPRTYHLPTKVTGVPKDEGGAPIETRASSMSEAEANAALDEAIAEATRRRAK